ncbi:MAG: thioredoxin domain-containing protein, partial [Candidatus Methanoperedens sp.]|nr:thioredoxin domain-containing protein [Candidatus Methanoperedens sp.]
TLLEERAANLQSTIVAQLPTPAPTLDMPVLVSTVQVGVVETLIANVTQQVAQEATFQAAQQATQTARDTQPADVSADDDPFWGPEDAQVTIVQFSDFSCPHCYDFAIQTMPHLKVAYSDRVRFVFRDAPILGPASGWAALAAECADDQGKFWEYHDLLFANQGDLTRQNLTVYAQQVGLDTTTFDTCVDNQTHLEELQNDLSAAQAAGVSGTPTFFINGRRVVGAQPYEVFAQIIDEELEKVGLPTGPMEVAVAATEEVAVEVTEEAIVTEAAEEVVVEATEEVAVAATAVNAPVQIVEVVGAGDRSTEAVVIRNTGSTINLNGWTLIVDTGYSYTFGERMLFTDAQVSLFTKQGQDTPVSLFWNRPEAVYEPGAALILRDQNGEVQSTYRVP